MAITYPLDIRETIIERNPYLKLNSFKFRERNFVFENSKIKSQSEKKTNLQSYYLPIPQSITNSHNLNWEMTDLKAIKGVEEIFASDNVLQGLAGSGGNLGAIVFDGTARLKGLTANPKKQALFNGIEPRTFSFEWTFSPQSLKDAETLERLIRELTKASLPNLINSEGEDDETSAFFDFPDEFEISFMNVAGFPKIYNVVCTSVNTNYTPNQLQLLTSGHAVQTTVSLSFLETELLRKTKPGI